MKIKDINFTPLTAVQSENAWTAVIKDTFKIPLPLLAVITLVLLIMSVVITHTPLVMFALVVVAVYLAPKVRAYQDDAWKKFAAANKWETFDPNSVNVAFLPSALMRVGNGDGKLSTVVKTTFDNIECFIYGYTFTTGSGKSQRTHYYTIARVALPREFPHIILDSKRTLTLQNRGSANRKVKLEGNFDKYFSLYCSDGDEIDALSVISPDVMHTLIASNQGQDIEISDANLYFMAQSDERSPQSLPLLLEAVDKLSDEILHRAKSIRYKGNQVLAEQVSEHTAAQYLQGEYRRVQDRRNWTILITFIVLMLGMAIYYVTIAQ